MRKRKTEVGIEGGSSLIQSKHQLKIFAATFSARKHKTSPQMIQVPLFPGLSDYWSAEEWEEPGA